MIATKSEAALLAAVRANPGEDAPRLVYADWLEENAETAACAACKGEGKIGVGNNGNPYMASCDECHGTGRVSDGRAELAEFIRVQVRIAELNRGYQESGHSSGGPMRGCVETSKLITRERELWPAVRVVFGVHEFPEVIFVLDRFLELRDLGPQIHVSRGLPSVVRCTLAEWMGGECERCGGTRLVHYRPPRGTNYDTMGSVETCPACRGEGRTPGIGPRLAQRWPVVRVEVPYQTALHGSVDEWFMEETPPRFGTVEARLPWSIYRKLRGGIAGGWSKSYLTESAARAALSDALIQWARGQAIEDIK